MRCLPTMILLVVLAIAQEPAVNLYDMYLANDLALGFWVKRRSWGNLCARVTFVGELERNAYRYGLPSVRADLFCFGSLDRQQADAELTRAWDPKMWRRIPPPPLHTRKDAQKPALLAAPGESQEC